MCLVSQLTTLETIYSILHLTAHFNILNGSFVAEYTDQVYNQPQLEALLNMTKYNNARC